MLISLHTFRLFQFKMSAKIETSIRIAGCPALSGRASGPADAKSKSPNVIINLFIKEHN